MLSDPSASVTVRTRASGDDSRTISPVSGYDDAVRELYQTPLASFVGERKRLATDLKAAGDREGAAKLAKLPRPTISAWVVNQLYWHARDAFDALMATAHKLRAGDLGATANHREAIAALRKRADSMLEDAGHAATESTLRRVTQTLAALAASGGFDPDLPGTLAADRDPPGFEAIGIGEAAAPVAKTPTALPAKRPPAAAAHKHHGQAKHPIAHELDAVDELKAAREAAAEKARQREAEQAAQRAQKIAEKKREEHARAQQKAERHRLEAALRTADGEVASRERAVAALKQQLHDAEHAVDTAKKIAKDLERKLDE